MSNNFTVVDGNGDTQVLKSTDNSGVQTPHHNVDTLPSAFTTDTAAVKTAVQALAAIIGAGRLAVDLSSTVVTYLANLTNIATYLSTLQGAVASARIAVDLATTPTANLAALAAAIGSAAAQEHTTAASPHSVRLSTGSVFYDSAKTGQLPTALGTQTVANSLSITHAGADPAVVDASTSGTLGSLSATVQTATGARAGVGFCIISGTLVGTVVAEYLIGNWQSTTIFDPATGTTASSLSVSSPGTDVVRAVLVPPGATQVRIRVSAWTSGTCTGVIAPNNANPTVGKLDSIIAAQAVPSGGPKFGQNAAIGSGSDAQFTSQALSRGMVITNLDTAINLLVSHQTGPSAAGATTRTIKPGMSSSFIACTNVTAVYMRSASGTIAACYEGV